MTPVKHGPKGMPGTVAGKRIPGVKYGGKTFTGLCSAHRDGEDPDCATCYPSEFGTPYSVGEARAHLEHSEVVNAPGVLDQYAADLIRWLCDRVEELERADPDQRPTFISGPDGSVAPTGPPPGVPTRGGEKRRK